MPSSIMVTGKWKKALLPTLGSRRRDRGSASRPLLSTANTEVSGIHIHSAAASLTDGEPARDTTQDNTENRLVSALLDTTTEGDVKSVARDRGNPAQAHHFARSHTVSAMSSSSASSPPSSPLRSRPAAHHAPDIPRRSSRRNVHHSSSSRDSPKSSPGRNPAGLVRPLPGSQSASAHLMGRQSRNVPQSSSGVLPGITGHYKGGSPIRRGGSDADKISHSVTSILATSQDLTGKALDSPDPGRPLKTSRSRTRNVLNKFTGVLSDHFGAKGPRKREKVNDIADMTSSASSMSTRQAGHGLSPSGPPLKQFSTTSQVSADTTLDFPIDEQQIDRQKARLLTSRADAVSSVAKKRLTIVDEVDFQSGQALEDPFSESSSGQHSTEFEARLKLGQARTLASPTDPFQAERLLDTSVEAILTTPPVGCSTPRRQPRSWSRCEETPTKGSRTVPGDRSGLIALSPGGSLTQPGGRHTVRPNPRTGNKGNVVGRKNGDLAGRATSGAKGFSPSDSTRLSSFPPGSTIRHVPRSMGRLKDAPSLPIPASHRDTTRSMARKKHPSPSKGQLEMFGKFMEKNMTLGIFKDADELGMSSLYSPQPNSNTLSPRDTNRLMRGSRVSNTNLPKNHTSQGNQTGLSKSRSRIPQPVRQLSRSRTDTVYARDFYPANKGDSTTEDELQWDDSAYKIGHRCNHCGSMNQII